jgi:hypothetical protein
MTQEQKDVFISIAQMGVACGLDHPYEWLMNYDLHAPQLMAYTDTNKNLNKVYDAFLAFFHGCGGCPEDPMETWSQDQMIDAINEFYRRSKDVKS